MTTSGKARSLPRNADVAEQFELLADLLELEGAESFRVLAYRRGRIPPEVVDFMRLPGLGPKSAARIWRELGISTLAELRAAAEAERLRTLPGFGARTEERLRQALRGAQTRRGRGRAPGQGPPAVLAVVSVLREHPAVDLVSEAGSVRR